MSVVVLWGVVAVCVVYGLAGAWWMWRWARRVEFSVKGEGAVGVAIIVLLWLIWPAMMAADDEMRHG